MRKLAILATALACLCAPVQAKKKASSAKAAEKRASADGRFSYAVPKGFASAELPNAVASWTNAKDKNPLGIYPVAADRAKKLGSPLKAADASRKRAEEKGGWTVSKVYKKTLGNGMDFLFYSAHQNGKNLKIAGYFSLGGDFYFVSGWVARTKYGMPGLYAALDTIAPIAGPRGSRAKTALEAPSLLKQQEEKTKGPSGVSLGEGSGTPKMLGGPKRTGGPIQ